MLKLTKAKYLENKPLKRREAPNLSFALVKILSVIFRAHQRYLELVNDH